MTVLTGFLGSGKTTLLNRILTGAHGVRFGVLVNDFGEVNIDTHLVTALDGQAIDLSNGCVCCTMQGGLVSGILKLRGRQIPPEHLIVEASGIADPLGVVSAFRTDALRDEVRLDAVITTVDAANARDTRLDRQVVEDQIRAADLLLLNKVDLVDEASRRLVRAWLQKIVPDVHVIETVRGDAPLDIVLGTLHRGIRSRNATTATAHRVTSWTYRTTRPLAYRRVRAALESLPDTVFRAKGILHLADAPGLRFVAHRVGRRTAVEILGPWGSESPETEVVLLGPQAEMDAEDLTRRFDACATDAVPLLAPQSIRRLRERTRLAELDAALTVSNRGGGT